MKKNILIDGFNLGLEKGTGVSTYARNLSYQLRDLDYDVSVLYGMNVGKDKNALMQEIGFFDQGIEARNKYLQLLKKGLGTFGLFTGASAFKIELSGLVEHRQFRSKLPHFNHLLNARDVFSKADRRHKLTKSLLDVSCNQKIDLAHWTYPIPIKLQKARNVYTLHDLVPLKLPYTTLDKKRHYFRLIKQLLDTADGIVTVSESSKKDIIEFFDFPEDKITNTYQSVSLPSKYADKPDEEVQREIEGTFNIPYKNYFLFFGSIEPKKNVGRLIEAYLSLKTDTPLVIVGAQAWKSDQELKLLQNPGTTNYLEQVGPKTYERNRVVQLGYAPFPLLVSLIKGAKAVTFPSLYEGFGLPILEAMSLGTPVLTSREGSIPEVSGDAALLIDAYDSKSIAEGIFQLDNDEGLRNELSIKGKKQAAIYSEEAYKEKLQSFYSGLL